ncbi:TetR/AcrR family transcriptional regulator [Streptomyces sp. NPDC101151]|uniref:TetR/AcrR family transcriptional regulator n=1 Tax=Streptomyces sp. NPDC101151 TaxID=3366115 RepID=UPI003819F0E5
MEPKQPDGSRGRNTGARRRSRLSQAVIVAAAQHIISTGGDGSLSMRQLARELSITPMALYHHVRDKDELLMLLLETKAQNVSRPPLPADPRERLVTSSQLLYDMLADCPFLGEILSSEDLMTASNLWIIEAVLDAAVDCGFAPDEAVGIYRVIWHYTSGELMIRLTRERRLAELDQPPYRERVFADIEPRTYPRLHALADRWTDLTARQTHRKGLEALVAGFLRGAGTAPWPPGHADGHIAG